MMIFFDPIIQVFQKIKLEPHSLLNQNYFPFCFDSYFYSFDWALKQSDYVFRNGKSMNQKIT